MSEPAHISARDLREINDASSFALFREKDVNDILSHVNDMGSFKLWWDSKVPENDKWFFNSISFKSSDPKALKKEIVKYKNLYDEMKTAIRQVREGAEGVDELILDLYDKLSEMHSEAESKVGSTDSKTLYSLHQEFVDKYQLLENKVKRVEVVAVRQQLRRARDDWREAVNEIRVLRQEMQQAHDDNQDLTDRFERLMTINEQLVTQQQELRQENTLIRTLLEDLVRRQ